MAGSRSSALHGLVLVVGLVVGWQILFEIAGENALAPPLETMRYLLGLLSTATFWGHLVETARAFAMALALSIVLGLAAGFVLGLHRFSGEVAEPILVAFYSVPKITLYPIVLLAFGLGVPAKVAFGTIHGIVPIAISGTRLRPGPRRVRPPSQIQIGASRSRAGAKRHALAGPMPRAAPHESPADSADP